ncbi:MAG: DUF3309 domain-containing protein [Polyangiaceae bacterium]
MRTSLTMSTVLSAFILSGCSGGISAGGSGIYWGGGFGLVVLLVVLFMLFGRR